MAIGIGSSFNEYDPYDKARLGESENILRDVNLFLNDLPIDMGRCSLNGWRTQLQHKITSYLKGE